MACFVLFLFQALFLLRNQTMKYTLAKNVSAAALFLYSTYSQASLFTQVVGGVGDISFTYDDYTITNALSESSVAVNGVLASTGSVSIAQYGILKISTFGSTVVPSDVWSTPVVHGSASAQYSDSVTLSSAELTGKKGLVTVDIYNEILIDTHSLIGGLSPRARYGFEFGMSTAYLGIDDSRVVISANAYSNINDVVQGGYSAEDYYGANYNLGYDVNKFSITQEFVFGTPLQFYNSMWADGVIPTNLYPQTESEFARFLVDAGNSTYWGGIQSVKIDGVEITDYQLTSDSGTDYSRSFVPTSTQPDPTDVPEPATLVLISLGLLSLCTRRGVTTD